MIRRKIPNYIFVFALLLLGAPALLAGGEEVLLQADRAFARATAEKGLEGFASFLAEDVWLLQDGRPIIRGKQDAAESWRGLLASPDLSITWEPVLAALARPEHKVREVRSDGQEYEDWIYGIPPCLIFVTFLGDKVVEVREFK